MTDQPTLNLGHLAQDIAFVSRTLRAHINAANERRFDMPSGHIALLNLIALNPGISQNDLAAAVVVKKSAVAKAVNELEARALVAREKTGKDKRFNELVLTPEGTALTDTLRAAMAAHTDRILSPLSPAERAILFELLHKVTGALATDAE